MVNKPLEFILDIGDYCHDENLEELYEQCHHCQNMYDRFLIGEVSEDDFCDVLLDYGVDIDEIALIAENNARLLGLE